MDSSTHTYINQGMGAHEDDDDYQEGYEVVGPPRYENNVGVDNGTATPIPESSDKEMKKRKILILVACTFLSFCQSIVFSMAILGKTISDLEQEKADDIRMALVITRKLGVPIASLLMIRLGYRIVGVLGCSMVGLGLFIAAWIPRVAVDAIAFLVGGLAGLGFAFLALTIIVPILDYFNTRRLRALIVVRSAEALAVILFAGITIIPEVDIDWRLLYRYQLIVMVVAAAACVLLKPFVFPLGENSTKFGLLLGLDDFSIFKGPELYMLVLVVFVDQIGKPLPVSYILDLLINPEKMYENLNLDSVLFLAPVGNILGFLALLIWYRDRLIDMLLLVGPMNVVIGLLTLQAPALDKFGWIVVYLLIFGIGTGVFVAVVDNVVPQTFGKPRIRIVEGMLGLASGLGHLVSLPIADAIQKSMTISGTEASFYISGTALMTSGVIAIGFRLFLTRRRRKMANVT